MLFNEMVYQGGWLFRWRSYLPFMIAPIFILFFYEADWFHWSYSWFAEEAWDVVSLIVALVGLAGRVLVAGYALKGTSGRNTVQQSASRLNSTGMYSIVRHPLYLANFLIFLGFVLLFKSAILLLITALVFFLYYERIMLAEESYLDQKFGSEFRAWSLKTPAFVPRISIWQRADTSFSVKSMIRREHQTLFLIVSFFVVFEILDAVALEGRHLSEWSSTELHWLIVLCVVAAFYVATQFVKKCTTLLNVAGR